MTKKQRQREDVAKLCDRIVQGRSIEGSFLRAVNRAIDKKKGRTSGRPRR